VVAGFALSTSGRFSPVHRGAAQFLVFQQRIRNGRSHETQIQTIVSQRRELQRNGQPSRPGAIRARSMNLHAGRAKEARVERVQSEKDYRSTLAADAQPKRERTKVERARINDNFNDSTKKTAAR